MTRDEWKAAFILSAIALMEGMWCVANLRAGPLPLLRYAGFEGRQASATGWLLAIAVFVLFTASAARLPSVRSNLFRPSRLKLISLAVAVAAGFCEEAVFRKLLMDWLGRGGYDLAVQIGASALAFGAAHAVWGVFRGSVPAALGAMIATGLLGGALAVVYGGDGRVLAPCVVSHMLINALAEPGLMLAAVRGEMSRGTTSGRPVP